MPRKAREPWPSRSVRLRGEELKAVIYLVEGYLDSAEDPIPEIERLQQKLYVARDRIAEEWPDWEERVRPRE